MTTHTIPLIDLDLASDGTTEPSTPPRGSRRRTPATTPPTVPPTAPPAAPLTVPPTASPARPPMGPPAASPVGQPSPALLEVLKAAVQPQAPSQGAGVEGILAFLVQQARDREEKERQERRDREERDDRERQERRDREEREREERRREEEARRREDDARREREEARNAQRMALFGSLATAFAPVVIELVKAKSAAPAPAAMPDLRPVLDTMTSMIEQNQKVSATLLDATIDRAKTIAGLGQPEKPGILDRLASVAEAVAPAIAARFAGEAPATPTPLPAPSVATAAPIPLPLPPASNPTPTTDMPTTPTPTTDDEPTLAEILTACEVPSDATGLRRALWILRAFHAGLPDETWIDDLMAEVKAQIPQDLAAAISAGDSAQVLAQAQPVVMADSGLMRWIMGGGGAWLQGQMGNLRTLFDTK